MTQRRPFRQHLRMPAQHARRRKIHSRSLIATTVLLSMLGCLGCDPPLESGGCDEQPISKALVRVLYWGRVSPSQDVPNGGEYGSGDIRQPVWYRSDRIFVRSEHLDSGAYVRGISDVAIDSVTFSFRAINTLSFPYLIRDFDYNTNTSEFVITFSQDPFNIQTVRASATSSELVVVDTVLAENWFPRGARFVEPDGALVVYATDPATQISGYYCISNPPAPEDSLIVKINLPAQEARGFDVAGGRMCFGRTNDTFDTEVSVIDLLGDRIPRAVRVVSGEFRSIGVDPTGSCAIIATERFFGAPGANVGVLDLATGSFSPVDVQTRPCTFAIADFAFWNPRGTSFAFSAGGYTGEQAVYPRQLWVRRGVVCR